MELKFDPRALWARVEGSQSELQGLALYLDHWARSLDPTGVGRHVYLWRFGDLLVLHGALVAAAQAGAITAAFGPAIDPTPVLRRSLRLLDADLLRDYQARAASAAVEAPAGRCVIDLAMGGGKTRVAVGIVTLAASCGAGRWLYLVQNTELAAQSERAFADLLPKMCQAIGVKHAAPASLTATTFSGVARLPDPVFDGIIVDECQALPPPTRAFGFARATSTWKIGLSGTPLDRQDAGNALTLSLLGPVVFRAGLAELTAAGYLSTGRVQPVVWDRGLHRVLSC